MYALAVKLGGGGITAGWATATVLVKSVKTTESNRKQRIIIRLSFVKVVNKIRKYLEWTTKLVATYIAGFT